MNERKKRSSYKLQVEAAQEFNPTLVNCHALKDCFTEEMAEEFFTEALAWQEKNNYRYKKLIASLFYNFHQFQSVP